MHAVSALSLVSFVFAGMVSAPLEDRPSRQEPRHTDGWLAGVTSMWGNEKQCGHAMTLQVREEGNRIAVWDAAARRQLIGAPVREDGSASLETYSAALGARVSVTVPAGTGPREFQIQKKWPVVCVYEIAPK